MKIQVLASSSKGNSTYINIDDKNILIDVGLGYTDIVEKLEKINIKPNDIDTILITHAHTDHIKSLYPFYRKHKAKIYISNETYKELPDQIKEKVKTYYPVEELENIDDIKITKIPISHDKKGFGFVLETNKESLVYITDTGMIHQRYHKYLENKTAYIIESNHDVEMVMNGTKDHRTKIRNIGDSGHLSNNDCANYLSKFIGDKTKTIFLAHISEHDNTYELAYNTTRNKIDKNIDVILTHNSNPTNLVEI